MKYFIYILYGFAISFMIFSFNILYPHFETIKAYYDIENIDILAKIIFTAKMYLVFFTNNTLFSATISLLIALLSALNIILLAIYIKKNKTNKKEIVSISGMGLGGFISAFLGLGCAACGTFVLGLVLSYFGAGALLTILPLGGLEVGILGIFILSATSFFIYKKIKAPLVCKTN